MIRYIIDGHNMINSVPQYNRLLKHNYVLCLKTLYQDLLNYTESKSVCITLVFDGNAPWDPIDKSDRFFIEFSGKQKDGDTLVIDFAEKWQGRQTVVVTEDRVVCRAAAGFGCLILSPREFNRLITSREKTKSRLEEDQDRKPEQLTKSEILWWKAEMKKALDKRRR